MAKPKTVSGILYPFFKHLHAPLIRYMKRNAPHSGSVHAYFWQRLKYSQVGVGVKGSTNAFMAGPSENFVLSATRTLLQDLPELIGNTKS